MFASSYSYASACFSSVNPTIEDLQSYVSCLESDIDSKLKALEPNREQRLMDEKIKDLTKKIDALERNLRK